MATTEQLWGGETTKAVDNFPQLRGRRRIRLHQPTMDKPVLGRPLKAYDKIRGSELSPGRRGAGVDRLG